MTGYTYLQLKEFGIDPDNGMLNGYGKITGDFLGNFWGYKDGLYWFTNGCY